MNAISWALLALVILAAAFALRASHKSKGGCSCGSCEGCKQSCCKNEQKSSKTDK